MPGVKGLAGGLQPDALAGADYQYVHSPNPDWGLAIALPNISHFSAHNRYASASDLDLQRSDAEVVRALPYTLPLFMLRTNLEVAMPIRRNMNGLAPQQTPAWMLGCLAIRWGVFIGIWIGSTGPGRRRGRRRARTPSAVMVCSVGWTRTHQSLNLEPQGHLPVGPVRSGLSVVWSWH